MKYKCDACGEGMATADVARQGLARVIQCGNGAHRGPFSLADYERQSTRTRPENVATRKAVEEA